MKYGSFPSFRRYAASEHSTIGVLDIGASKVSCFIAELVDDAIDGQDAEVIGVGHQGSVPAGDGGLTGLDRARMVKETVAKAQSMAGRVPSAWHVAVSGRHIVSKRIAVDLCLEGQAVLDEDLQDCHRQGARLAASEKSHALHLSPSGYMIDGHEGIANPLGLSGDNLTAYMLSIAASQTAIANLENCLEHCRIKPDSFIAAPYAASMAVLQEEEKSLGSICLDIGAKLTGFTLYNDNSLVLTGAVALGSDHITRDIAKVCGFDLASAERAKTLYGTSFCSPGDETRSVGVSPGMADRPLSVAELAEVIGPRVEEILRLVAGKVRAAGLDPDQFSRVVLTGGGSQLQGLSELIEATRGGKVRVGRPLNLFGAPEAVSGAAFSVCAGMIRHVANLRNNTQPTFRRFAASSFSDVSRTPHPATHQSSNPLFKAAGWLRDHF
ncbi:cell division protein FtsA [Parvularcula sp. IMCC14364]|uniref:cell division protein FtsA n=1 Tax=Parvularcula sp. IMCC14364 TaxID=3067902 RepID=UPI0027428C23|nr:cell division protein FtsA [Parvularcula sp. IMCC14364]